jgi:hypothetical protein
VKEIVPLHQQESHVTLMDCSAMVRIHVTAWEPVIQEYRPIAMTESDVLMIPVTKQLTSATIYRTMDFAMTHFSVTA